MAFRTHLTRCSPEFFGEQAVFLWQNVCLWKEVKYRGVLPFSFQILPGPLDVLYQCVPAYEPALCLLKTLRTACPSSSLQRDDRGIAQPDQDQLLGLGKAHFLVSSEWRWKWFIRWWLRSLEGLNPESGLTEYTSALPVQNAVRYLYGQLGLGFLPTA